MFACSCLMSCMKLRKVEAKAQLKWKCAAVEKGFDVLSSGRASVRITTSCLTN